MSQLLSGVMLEEDGQDLIEYSLLITFIAIACMAFLGLGEPAVNTIWNANNARLEKAAVAASGG